MFQPTTECVDSLTIDDVTGQAVPESGTLRCTYEDDIRRIWIQRHYDTLWLIKVMRITTSLQYSSHCNYNLLSIIILFIILSKTKLK